MNKLWSAILLFFTAAASAQQVDLPASALKSTTFIGPLDSVVVSTGALAHSTRLINTSNLLESLAAETNWAAHVQSSGQASNAVSIIQSNAVTVGTLVTNLNLLSSVGNIQWVFSNLLGRVDAFGFVQGLLTNNTTGNAGGATNDQFGNPIAAQFANGTNQTLKIGLAATNNDTAIAIASTNESLLIGQRATNNDIVVTPTNGIAMTTNAQVVTIGANFAPSAPVTFTTNGSGQITIGVSGVGSGTVTSVGLSPPGGLSVLGSPVTTSGTISLLAANTPGFWMDNGSGVTSWSWDGSSLINLNGSQITSGTIADARLNSDVTKQGNVFNGASQLLQLNVSDQIPALDGSLLFNLNASALASGLVPNARINWTNNQFYISSGAGASFTIWTTNGAPLLSVSNNQVTINTNVLINGTLTINSPTNTDWISNLVATGWALLQGAETNSSITAASGGFLAIDNLGGRSAGTFGAGLTFSGGVLSANNSGSYILSLNGFGTNTTFYGTNTFGTNAAVGMTTIDGLGNIRHYGSNQLFTVVDNNSNNVFSVSGSSGLTQIIGTLFESNLTSQIYWFNSGTNYQLWAIGTNGGGGFFTNLFYLGNGVTSNQLQYINPVAQNVFAVQTNGAWQLGTNAQTSADATGNVTLTKNFTAANVTDTSFAAIGVTTNDATGKLFTTPTLPSTLIGSGLAVVAGNTGNQAVPVNSSAWYHPYNTSTNITTSDASGVTRMLIPANTTLQNFYALASGNPGAVANTVNWYTNGVLMETLTLNNVTTANDTSSKYPVLAGWELGVKVVSAASGTAVKWSWANQMR